MLNAISSDFADLALTTFMGLQRPLQTLLIGLS